MPEKRFDGAKQFIRPAGGLTLVRRGQPGERLSAGRRCPVGRLYCAFRTSPVGGPDSGDYHRWRSAWIFSLLDPDRRNRMGTAMIKTFSQRLSPPFTGLAQIAQSERARAVTLDGDMWEIHFIRGAMGANGQGTFRRVAYLSQDELTGIAREGTYQGQPLDERILELAGFLVNVRLPFPALDRFEYWLLDGSDESPLAFVFSCTEAHQMQDFPDRPEWTALAAAAMKIESSEEEKAEGLPPVNYRLERLVAERAGSRPRAAWFERGADAPGDFPKLLLREDWNDPAQQSLCQRYLDRQSTRLLMLQGLTRDDRLRLEQASRPHALEVERFFPIYPEVIDGDLMNTIRVEARMRGQSGEEDPMQNRRDGVLYQ